MSRELSLSVAALLVLCSGLGLWLDRGRRGGAIELGALLPLVPLAAIVVAPGPLGPQWVPLVSALVVGVLLRPRDDVLHSECAVKLLWVIGPAIALSGVGLALLTILTSTTVPIEQWAVIGVESEPRLLWATAYSLSLLCGVVLLGVAPFHFWPADVLQGARPWIAPLAVSTLQCCGAAWLIGRLDSIDTLPAAARIADTLLGSGAGVALVVGALTLSFQRRPERRVGTLAGLNGALVLALLSIAHSPAGRAVAGVMPGPVWCAHLALALAGAGALAPFLPVSQRVPGPGPVMFRRHPVWGGLGLYSLASLAGVPGTPGALLWLAVGRALLAGSRPLLVLLLAIAWAAAFASVVRQARESLGVPSREPVPPAPVPVVARCALLASAAGVLVLWVVAMR